MLEFEATARKVLGSDLKNLLLRTRLEEHTATHRKLYTEYLKERRRLINNNQYSPETFYVAKVSQDLQSFLKSQMTWKKGRYVIEFRLNTRNFAKVSSPVLAFEISEEDIILMQNNSENMPKLIHNDCYSLVGDDNLLTFQWQWLDKELTKM
ncbi:MAG: hypothetical protein IPG80_15325 [Anaerolineales bacterium]|uniref:hypothetical protein n=1 Tax=Candidatus Villigracilis vicinus TaxID=3140679 RepID=UPI00313639DD|nr:hypothetical protein [Anaerolineales bacterium]